MIEGFSVGLSTMTLVVKHLRSKPLMLLPMTLWLNAIGVERFQRMNELIETSIRV